MRILGYVVVVLMCIVNCFARNTPNGETQIVLSNESIRLEFQDARTGFGLKAITNVKSGYNFITNPAREESLWVIRLKNEFNQFITIDNTVASDRTYNVTKASSGQITSIDFFWKNISLGSEARSLDVTASVRLEGGMSYWKFSVVNGDKTSNEQNAGYGLWEVTYPAVRRICAAPRDSIYLAYPRFLGQLIKNPIDRMPVEKMFYPSYRSKMQFSTLYKSDGTSGLYVGTFDQQANEKKFYYDLDLKGESIKYGVIHYPPGMGQPNNEYVMPYEAAIGVYEGDWITASKTYRSWAVQQMWCSKGKLSERKDIPEWYLNTVLWFSGMYSDKIVPLAKYLDVPIAYQWYNWHEVPFDSYLPDYFPPKEGFEKKIKNLQSSGIKIVPYINSRVWEINSKSWKEENPYAAATKGPYQMLDGLSIHNWGKDNKELAIHFDHWAGYNHAVMCPYTRVWQNKQVEIIKRLVDEYHVNGVYMDQIASFYPVLCFDPGHGHTIGGGNYWVSGYREMVKLANKESRTVNPGTILTSEDHAETYLDLFDGNLACNSTSIAPELIPMFHHVYAGYALTFGRATGRWHTEWEGDEFTTGLPLIMRNAQLFIWGEQLGWFHPNVLPFPSEESEYIKNLCDALELPPK